MPLFRRVLVALALVLLAVAPPPSNAAPSAAAFDGELSVSCFGCGYSSGEFAGTLAGVVDGVPFAGAVDADFVVSAPYLPDDPCVTRDAPIEGIVRFGTTSGQFRGSLTVTSGTHRDDVHPVVFTPGTLTVQLTVELASGATALLHFGGPVTQPIGTVCAGPVLAVVEGALGSASTGAGCVVGTCDGQRHAVAFEGTWSSECLGCGFSEGTATLNVTHAGAGGLAVGDRAEAEFLTSEPVGVTCLLSGTAAGTITGAINVDFTFVRFGPHAVMTTRGDVTGSGFATWFVTAPVGNPCGGPAEAYFAAEIVGP